jgi:hypothetical protein
MTREEIIGFIKECEKQNVLLYRKNWTWMENPDYEIFVKYKYLESFGDSEYEHTVTERARYFIVEPELKIILDGDVSFDELDQYQCGYIVSLTAYKPMLRMTKK